MRLYVSAYGAAPLAAFERKGAAKGEGIGLPPKPAKRHAMFTVEYHRDGVRRAIARDVLPYGQKAMWRIPSFPELSAKLAVPAYVLQALQRTTWDMAASDVVRADLTDKRGRPIGTIIARWEA